MIDRDASGLPVANKAIMIAHHEVTGAVAPDYFDKDDRLPLLHKILTMVADGRMTGNVAFPSFNADEAVLEDWRATSRPPSAFQIRKIEDCLIVRRVRYSASGAAGPVEYSYFFRRAQAKAPF
ncbi:MAG: hypothetical protein HYZ74_00105 [Elusimicrobia bacterium]|nr:hypothetical protein [Elusimicrobiota bacterium]